jgi:hypothetical protein
MGFQVIDAQGRLKGATVYTEFTTTSTGNIDNLDFSNADLIRMNNASLATIRGLVAGYPGQRVTIMSIGAGQVDFAHQNAGSDAANRLINKVTSTTTPMAAGLGSTTYVYDGTTLRWRLEYHEQGDFIDVAHSAGNFTTEVGSWTVASGDQIHWRYYLKGRTVFCNWRIDTSTNSSAATHYFLIALPNSFTAAVTGFQLTSQISDSGTEYAGVSQLGNGTSILISKLGFGTFAANTDTLYIRGAGWLMVS